MKDINNSMGINLSSNQLHSFEHAFEVFKKKFDPTSKEAGEKIDEMSKLLSVSEENLEQIKNQTWFQRIWKTISGSNKELNEINKKNLLTVQNGSLFFLNGIAQENQIMRSSIYFALKDVNNSKFQLASFKVYLLKYMDIVEEVDDKLTNFGGRLSHVERKINKPNHWLMIVFVCSLVGIFLSNYFFNDLGFIVIGSILILLFAFLGFQLIKSEKRNTNVIQDNPNKLIVYPNHVTEYYELRQKVHKYIYNLFLMEEFPALLTKAFHARYDEVERIMEKDIDNDKEFERAISDVLKISPDIIPQIRSNCSLLAKQFTEINNQFAIYVIDNYLNSSIKLKLESQLDIFEKEKRDEKILSIIEPYFENIKELIDLRSALLSDYPRFKSILLENHLLSIGKNFMKGLLIIPALMDDTDDFTKKITNDIRQYYYKWDNIAEAFNKAIIPYFHEVVWSWSGDIANNIEFMLRKEFIDISGLQSFKKYLEEQIEIQQNNLE